MLKNFPMEFKYIDTALTPTSNTLIETGNRKFLNLAKDEHLVRLHIGLEDPNDLIDDLKKALKFIK